MKNEINKNKLLSQDSFTGTSSILTHGSLFSGVGGFELGAAMSGIETIWNCEFEEHNRKILKKHFPATEQYFDVNEMLNPKKVNIISGGFPCQDLIDNQALTNIDKF